MMNHTNSKVKVYITSDYKIFRNIDGNRPLNKKKIERIIQEINSGNDILQDVPILVKESGKFLDVLDGQHRLEIGKKLGRPVHYIVHSSDMSLYQVAKVNTNVEKWKDADFINCYKKAGNENYKKLEAFKNKYGFPTGVCIAILSGKQPGSGGDKEAIIRFQQGKFEVKAMKEATLLAEMCRNFEQFPGWNGRSFAQAISKIVLADKCDMGILVKKFLANPKALEDHSSAKGYLTNLELIYNHNNSKRRPIY